MRMMDNTPQPPAPPRYRRSGLAAEALRRALRQRVSMNQYGDMPRNLNDRQRAQVKDRVQTRIGNMQRNQPKLGDMNPVLRKLFLTHRNSLSRNNWQPGQNINQGGGPKAGTGKSPVGGVGSPGMSGLTPSHMQISENGQLDLPYDYNFSMDMIDAQEDINRELEGLQYEDQQQNLDYEITKRNAERDYKDMARQALNHFSGRGLAHSSSYGNEVAQQATMYNNFLGDLDQYATLFDQNIGNRRHGLEVALANLLRRAGLNQARGLEEAAGGLGYGKGSAEPSYGNPTNVIGRPKTAPKKPKKPRAKYKGRLKKAKKDGKVTAREFKRLGPKQKQIVRKQRRRRRAR